MAAPVRTLCSSGEVEVIPRMSCFYGAKTQTVVHRLVRVTCVWIENCSPTSFKMGKAFMLVLMLTVLSCSPQTLNTPKNLLVFSCTVYSCEALQQTPQHNVCSSWRRTMEERVRKWLNLTQSCCVLILNSTNSLGEIWQSIVFSVTFFFLCCYF